ncbi:DNA repair endonuclease XPF [Bacillus rossius redtenbacheri]|uniref:DNA repair endonuclease XPF n=1 Tax=Bacillus rossius redtenbacheri TaxID=93214 RepID=UPI002FDE35C7
MLEYENQIFLDILHEDGLVVAAKGLGLESVFLSLLKVYSDPGNLVIVLGTSSKEEEFYLSQLEAEGVKHLPRVVTNEYSSSDREIVYLEGGVLFMSSRILVVDLLKEKVPIANVTGFMVWRAHSILELCQEAFALRLYRQKNKTGFIKAFSNSAQSFTVGFAQVERVMKTLFVKNLYLWPRFHATVHASLEKLKPLVVELHIEMTPAMLQIQAALLDLMNFTVKEIKRCNPTLDTDDLTVENALSKSFHKVLQMQLDPMWHQLSTKTKQLVADLRTLGHILVSLTKYDCVTFNSQLSALRAMDYVLKNSGWMLLDAAETLFSVAKQRVLGRPREKAEADAPNANPEASPKWAALTEILKEINTDVKSRMQTGSISGSSLDKVLILVEDNRICEQLKQYFTLGGDDMLVQLYNKLSRRRIHQAQFRRTATLSPEKRAETPGECAESREVGTSEVEGKQEEEEDDESAEFQETYVLSQTQVDKDIKMEVVKSEQVDSSDKVEEDQPPMIVIQTFKKYGDPVALSRTLKEIQPRYVVMYDADMASIRRVEVYQSEHPEFQIQVYFLMYVGSVEEQAYLTTLRREKEAFSFLIKQKASMVIEKDQDGLSEDCANLSRDSSKPGEGPNTRKGGAVEQQARSKPSTIIVDMREFGSELPSLIHKRGIEIDPLTLQVGDYILTPEICVERKSVSDLIGSLNSGRLYNQALAMTRHYAKPMLLIEFDQNRPFALQGRYYVSNDIASNDITAKLQLLTLHFPKLRIVWSPSPYASAQLFEELKQGRAEPDGATAAAVGADLEADNLAVSDKYNTAIHDFVSKLPGINSKNIRSVLNKGQSLDHLLSLTQEQLGALVNNSAEATSLFDALHKTHRPSADAAVATRGGRGGKTRGRFFKRRKV